ncbi:MAG: dTDP-4-dehydrorhamnose 3,5-epimerase [Gemmatimonadetes bacterium]|nr:dTDP-4-dehydrorhamnose 3,5-epimerase [Gemmatimonadota bacterium]MBA4158637.1 dTDP-4-dehydrorhamnose 3,5-epimerase [Gemmatimonadota bacterium]
MNISETGLPGVLLIEPRVFRDERGWFTETWHRQRYAAAGLDHEFVQDNLSRSRHGVLRGLHFQSPTPQGKLVSVLQGSVFDVAVDLRSNSPFFGQWAGFELSAENGRQIYVPEGFAHGFVVTGETALFSYKCTAPFVPDHDRSLRWNDPTLGIDWPVAAPILSAKDAAAPLLCDIAAGELYA